MSKCKLLAIVVVFFVLINDSTIYCFSTEPWAETGNIIELTNQNFNSKTKQYDVLLVMFYAKWCSHCRRLHPNYEQAGTILLENPDSPIHIAKFDCTDNDKGQCSWRHNIRGYPTLRIYRYGRFNGEELNSHNRTIDELVKTMKALKKNSEQQGSVWFNSDQTDGVKDEVNRATINTQHTLLFVVLSILVYKLI